MTAESPAPVVELPSPDPGGATEIATLPPSTNDSGVSINVRTGEPRRSWLIRLVTVATWLAAGFATASLLWFYWIAVTDFYHASWLTAQFGKVQKLYGVLLVVGLTSAALLVAISSIITGYYAWFGYRWTRVAGIIAAALSPLTLLLNPVGWAAIPLAVLGAGLLWLPAATAHFQAWQDHRHPSTQFAAPVTSVLYGPLPRYRRD
ncbi:hypothetical protein [Propionicimonas sp.]|uniref:hypothetical protein n=1 Tax=Propionicimonas sp. TaxID=1955623 RepID=UPI00185CC607|nr:hypothetical protein [Propionicimonas sp.]MBU3978032.1 hypothetical protein [Actinomycetota bacterium]MBA3021982.1 hypothetical protein [Propionicimonas sp.]MBU3985526.1 hypothetical protein [Actinomycetota bacterium]MBU4007689.1 hypothetical protein [Actinomycetota bacterium]MBU4064464.1 hypothetical protein [Actinomycetota bacterium]